MSRRNIDKWILLNIECPNCNRRIRQHMVYEKFLCRNCNEFFVKERVKNFKEWKKSEHTGK